MTTTDFPPAPQHDEIIVPDSAPVTSPGPFEGPEKLLEVWFAPSLNQLPDVPESSLSGGLRARAAREEGEKWKGLRRVPREVWEEMLDIVKCKVLSVVEGEELDAYLLSESSLFVAPHLLILKTCGTTLNLLGLYRIIEIARAYCGYTNVWRCFYSRKSFFFPERQHGPHRDWRDEVDFLDKVFGTAGAAYTVGPMNRDHWLLYLTSPNTQPRLPYDSKLPSSLIAAPPSSSPPAAILPTKYQDTTLEILMSYMDPKARAPFFHTEEQTSSTPGHELGQIISSKLGIDELFPKDETTLDSFGFDPCGYSANAVIGTGMPEASHVEGKPGGGYFTIHVTPEEGWSYASFECNVPLPITSSSTKPPAVEGRPTLQKLIRNVVGIFQPCRLSITLFVSTTASGSGDSASSVLGASETEARAWQSFGTDLLGGDFVRKDRIGYEFDGYDLVFACFEKKGWKEPRREQIQDDLS
ncbi:S-adenosylmethionine decarboxylase proenzyme [Kwoniella shandongensis]|uniref:adenosylmethionine decarboxylase n=1 Tax=Kwoniella shandongensis TaxID=1734106 RepID=A0A5M6BTU1_9TREE|nr:S-adenosylmethionine decarboxylase proenzyme [Kwoniella shandongensis]KAA5526268.1 S-adenosylmethionine decarboxylase proenzyme [Kwoniella shandongensis]